MAPLRFGTDGMRGVANQELTPELCLALGVAAAEALGSGASAFLVGRDTRLSGPMVQAALSAGLLSAGVSVIDLGVLPTPAVAFFSAKLNVPAAVISASHNEFSDNGIKFFLPGGKKLSDEIEAQLETRLASPEQNVRGAGENVADFTRNFTPGDEYQAHLVQSLNGERLAGLNVVLDCANGAASAIAPQLFSELGATVTVLFDTPDGKNINTGCGSTHPGILQQTVVARGADVGFAFDGDADRVLAVDHTGALIDGDPILALLAIDAKANGRLKDDTLVVTVMANLGLRLAMENQNISVHETQVGDRYVLEALEANNWSLGGEQSGHVIFPELATTGDGMLTALQILSAMVRAQKSLHQLASVVTKLPQVLRNVRVAHREALASATTVWDAVAMAERELGHTGRVLLRTSGTEPLVRVMVEAATQDLAERICGLLCDVVSSELDD